MTAKSELHDKLENWVKQNKTSLSQQGIDIAPEAADSGLTVYAQSQPPSLWKDDDADDDAYVDIMGRLTLKADGEFDVELFDGDTMDEIFQERGAIENLEELTSRLTTFISKIRQNAKLED